MEKKTLIKVAFISGLLLSAVAGTHFNSVAKGNPFSQSAYSGERYPSVKVDPPRVTMLSPRNEKTYNTRDVSLSINVSTKGSKAISVGDFHYISSIRVKEVYFTADWLPNETMIYRSPSIEDYIDNKPKFFFNSEWYDSYQDLPEIDFEKLSLNLTNIPDGNHTVRVYAVGSGSEYYIFNWYVFYVTGVSKVNFVVDTTPPKITILQIENKIFADSKVPLNFTVNESVSGISYVLDGQDNSTLLGNMTLTELGNGLHNITVYAWDDAGNIGASETVIFTVAKLEPLRANLVVASAAAITVFGAVLLVYFRKRKR